MKKVKRNTIVACLLVACLVLSNSNVLYASTYNGSKELTDKTGKTESDDTSPTVNIITPGSEVHEYTPEKKEEDKGDTKEDKSKPDSNSTPKELPDTKKDTPTTPEKEDIEFVIPKFANQTLEKTIGFHKVVIKGEMPEGTYATVEYLTSKKKYERIISKALHEKVDTEAIFDIKLFQKDGSEYQPQEYDKTVDISITDSMSDTDSVFSTKSVYRINDDKSVTELKCDYSAKDKSIDFSTEHFTLFAVEDKPLYSPVTTASTFSLARSTGVSLTLGQTYSFGGYKWVVAEDKTDYYVLQSTGVTGVAWPGRRMSGSITNAAGNSIDLGSINKNYGGSIDGYDISGYNPETRLLYSSIKAAEKTGVSYGKGLYLVSNSKAGTTSNGSQGSGNYWKALKTAANNYSSFGASNSASWLGTVYGSDGAWYVNSSGGVNCSDDQSNSYVLAPAFNLDKTKVKLADDEIQIRDEYRDGIQIGGSYSFGGYEWIVVEDKAGYYVLQSTGVTSGAWPGYKMSDNITNAAGNSIDLGSANSDYSGNIDGYDISGYDTKTQELYNSIKAAEKTGVSYGKGLFLVSNAKAGTTTVDTQGSGNYYTALKLAAANYSSFGAASGRAAWLGTASGSKPWYIFGHGVVNNDLTQHYSFVVAPAFNLDKTKVEIVNGKIQIRDEYKVEIQIGGEYSFGGYEWIAAEQGDGYVVMQSTGVTSGTWPGYKMSGSITNGAGNSIDLGSANTKYGGNIDGYDISDYDTRTQELYQKIKEAEKTGVSYGKGLFLVSNVKAGTTSAAQGSGDYWMALKTAAENYSSFGASNRISWLGTYGDGDNVWYVVSNGNVFNYSGQSVAYVLAPAFNLDTSKIELAEDGYTIHIKTVPDTTWQDAYDYTLNGTANTITLKNYKGDATELVVPGSAIINGKKYTTALKAATSSSKGIWYNKKETVTSLSFGEGIILPTKCSYMFYDLSALTTLDVSKLDTSNVTDVSWMFRCCSSLTSLDVTKFVTSSVTDMSCMFNCCESLISLDVSNFDTSNVTDMGYMFYQCSSLTSLDVSKFNTSSVTDMSYMFYLCCSLTSLDLSNFDTSNIINMPNMFRGCDSLTSLDLSNFDTSSVINMEEMFRYCFKLTSLDLSKFDMTKVTNATDMLMGLSSLETLNTPKNCSKTVNLPYTMYDNLRKSHTLLPNVSESIKISKVFQLLDGDTSWQEDYEYTLNGTDKTITLNKYIGSDTELTVPGSSVIHGTKYTTKLKDAEYKASNMIWYDKKETVTSLSFEEGIILPTNCAYMFDGCSALTNLGISNFDTSNVTNMAFMFYGCSSLTSLNLSSFDTSKVTSMNYMFSHCESLSTLDLIKFDTSNVIGMSGMFYNCFSLTSLNLSKFDTSKVQVMGTMFRGCRNLTFLNLSGFKTSEVRDMRFMFLGCSKLTSLNLSNFNTSNITDMGYMFYDCSNLTSLDLSSFDTSNVTDMSYMFYDCSNLTSLDLSSFDTSNVTDVSKMFLDCSALKILKTPYNNQLEIKLPVKPMYDFAGEEYSVLTAGIAKSTTLYNYNPSVFVKANYATGKGNYKNFYITDNGTKYYYTIVNSSPQRVMFLGTSTSDASAPTVGSAILGTGDMEEALISASNHSVESYKVLEKYFTVTNSVAEDENSSILSFTESNNLPDAHKKLIYSYVNKNYWISNSESSDYFYNSDSTTDSTSDTTVSYAAVPVYTVVPLDKGTIFDDVTYKFSNAEHSWDISKTKDDDVTAYLFDDGFFCIAGTGYMKSFTDSNPTPWEDLRDSVVKVAVLDGVLNIGSYTMRFHNVTKISTGDTVTSLDQYAIYLPDGVELYLGMGISEYFANSVVPYNDRFSATVKTDNHNVLHALSLWGLTDYITNIEELHSKCVSHFTVAGESAKCLDIPYMMDISEGTDDNVIFAMGLVGDKGVIYVGPDKTVQKTGKRVKNASILDCLTDYFLWTNSNLFDDSSLEMDHQQKRDFLKLFCMDALQGTIVCVDSVENIPDNFLEYCAPSHLYISDSVQEISDTSFKTRTFSDEYIRELCTIIAQDSSGSPDDLYQEIMRSIASISESTLNLETNNDLVLDYPWGEQNLHKELYLISEVVDSSIKIPEYADESYLYINKDNRAFSYNVLDNLVLPFETYDHNIQPLQFLGCINNGADAEIYEEGISFSEAINIIATNESLLALKEYINVNLPTLEDMVKIYNNHTFIKFPEFSSMFLRDGTVLQVPAEGEPTSAPADIGTLIGAFIFTEYWTVPQLTNENSIDLVNDDILYASKVSGQYLKDGVTSDIPSDDIYIIEKSLWDANKSADNENLTKELTVSGDGGTYDYVIVIKNENLQNGYYAEEVIGVSREVDSTYTISVPASLNLSSNNNKDFSGNVSVGVKGRIADTKKVVMTVPSFTLRNGDSIVPVNPTITKTSWVNIITDSVLQNKLRKDEFTNSEISVNATLPVAGSYTGEIQYNFSLKNIDP